MKNLYNVQYEMVANMKKNYMLIALLAFLSINVCSKDQVTKINKVFVADEFELYPSSAFVFSDSSQGYASYSIVVDHYIHDETYNVYPVNEAGFNASGIKNLFKRIGKSGIFKRFLESKNIKNIRNWFREMLGMEKVKSGRIRVPPYFSHTKILIKTFEDIKSDEEISGKVSEYLEKAGFTTEKSSFVNAPIIKELPMTLECNLIKFL